MLKQRKKVWRQGKERGAPKKRIVKGLFLYSEGLVRKSQLFVKRNEVGLPQGTRGRGCRGDRVDGGKVWTVIWVVLGRAGWVT